MNKLVSKELVNFVKGFEGFSATVYNDCVGVPTIGYGMTGNEIRGLTYLTEEQASNMLEELLNSKYAAPLKADLDSKGVVLTQNEFDALVSMAYNVGVSGVLGSTLYRNICVGVRDKGTITSNFQMWSMAGGKRLEGLFRRRTEEAEMFFSNNADAPTAAESEVSNNSSEYPLPLTYNRNVLLFQKAANAMGIRDENGNRLDEDGVPGKNTLYVAKRPEALLKRGMRNPLVGAAQFMFGLPVDNYYGDDPFHETYDLIGEFQESKGLDPDHIVGYYTWIELFKAWC